MGTYPKIEIEKKVQSQIGETEVFKAHVLAAQGSFGQSPYLQETALLLAQGHVYDESSQLLTRLCGVNLSGKQVENLCHYYGENIITKKYNKYKLKSMVIKRIAFLEKE